MRSTQSIGTFDGPRSPKPSASSASAAAHNNILRIKLVRGIHLTGPGLCWMHGTTPRQHALP
jgi:hypothetical protein